MKRALPLILFFFLLGASFADFIDYEASYTLPKMREYLQTNADNYAKEKLRYELNLGLSIPASQPYRWLSGSGSYSNIRGGDAVCEGSFNYDLEIEAWALASTFTERNGEFGWGSPDSWPNCGSSTYPNCPGGDIRAYWSKSLYNTYYKDDGSSSKRLSNYRWRQISWRELEDDPWSTNEAAQVSTILRGTYRLNAGSSTIVGPLDASGTRISRSGSFSIYSTGKTTYTITERLDVTGALIGSFNPNVDWEYYKAFTELGASGQDEYSKSNIHDDGILYVYDENNVGVKSPAILYVDLYDDGSFPSPQEIQPGESIPVEIAVLIPYAPSTFYPLTFEFDGITMSGPSGFSFSATNLGTRCGTGYTNGASGKIVYLRGTLNTPSSLSGGDYPLSFAVQWKTCSGEKNCNGQGLDSQTAQVTVATEVVQLDPDLTCTLKPSKYTSSSAVSGGKLQPGEGVEEWQVTITNVGEGPAVISTSTERTCTSIMFAAIDGEGNELPQPIPGFYPFVSGSLPQTLEPGNSRTVTISNVPTYCGVMGGGNVEAVALVNSVFTPLLLPECSGQILSDLQNNNACTWEMECAPLPICMCQVYPHYPDGQAGESYDFDVLCNGEECKVPVSWSLTEGASYGTITSSDNKGASVLVAGEIPPDPLIRIQASMNLGCDETTVCSSAITAGGGQGCTLTPGVYQNGRAGQSYQFGLSCDGGSCEGPVIWSVFPGGALGELTSSPGSLTGATVLVKGGDGTVTVAADVGFDVCSATIVVGSGGGDDLLGCRIVPAQEYGHLGTHHDFELYCTYADSSEDECSGNWRITDGSEWVEGGSFSAGGDGHFWAELDIIEAIWEDEERVGILAVVPGDGERPAVDCDAEITLPPLDCLDLI